MSPLEAAQAEVARLELEARTIPFTTGDKEFIKTTKAAIEQLWRLLGHTRNPNAGNGGGGAFLKTIDRIDERLKAIERAIFSDDFDDRRTVNDRLDALEAETRGDYCLPANVAIKALVDRMDTFEAKAKGGRTEANERHQNAYEALSQRLNSIDNKIRALMSDDAPETVAAGDRIVSQSNADRIVCESKQNVIAQSVRDGLKAGLGVDDLVANVNAKWSETVEAARQSAETTKAVDDAANDALFMDMVRDAKAKKLSDLEAGVPAFIEDMIYNARKPLLDKVHTLKTEIATRDRLLDDQAATIGKLEAERDEAKDKLAMVLSRVDGMDLNNPDKMRGQRWVQDTGKERTKIVCEFYGDLVTVPRSMPEIGVQELRHRIERGYSK